MKMLQNVCKKFLLAVLPLFAVCCRVSAADTIKTFVLTGDYAFSHNELAGALDGTLTLDVDTGNVLSIDFDFVGRSPVQPRLPGGDEVSYFSGLTELRNAYGGFNGINYFGETITLPVSNLIAYNGGDICSQANPCVANSSVTSGTFDGYLVNGNLSLAPEPSTLVYLGSGLLPLVALARRRYARAQAR